MTNRKLVVSNYCTDLDWLKITYEYGISPQNTVIYSRTPDEYGENFSYLGEYIKSPNVGENIYDIFRFIIENYENLPDMSIFIKGNLFSRKKDQTHNHPKPGEKYEIDEFYYTTREKFIESLQTDQFLPIDRYHPTSLVGEDETFTQPVQYANFYYNNDVETRYFGDFHEISDAFFINPPKRNVIKFAPGGNYAVPKENILKYSKSFYQKLKDIVSYIPNPPHVRTSGESYLCERFLYFIWTEDLIERV
jgi:hypothetical protein